MYLSSTVFTSETCSGCASSSSIVYKVRVVATNHGGSTTSSNTIDVAVVSAPGAPTAVSATPGDTQLIVSWTAPSSNGGSAITGYKVEKKEGSGSYTPAVANTGSDAVTYTATGLDNGNSYTFKVSAINSAGTSDASTDSSAFTPIGVTNAVTDISAAPSTSGSAEVVVSWTAPSETGGSAVTGYQIFMQTNSGSFVEIASTTGSTATS